MVFIIYFKKILLEIMWILIRWVREWKEMGLVEKGGVEGIKLDNYRNNRKKSDYGVYC